MTFTQIPTDGAKLANEASFETTSRLLAALVNEGLVSLTVGDLNNVSSLVLRSPNELNVNSTRIVVIVRQETIYKLLLPGTEIAGEASTPVISPELDPTDIVGPVTIKHPNGHEKATYRPEEVFDIVGPWVCDEPQVLDQLRAELQNSADNQGKWLQFALSHPPPPIGAPLIEWEQRLIRGHPTHPMHRSFFATPPTKPVQFDDIETLLDAEITIISVPRARVHLDGPFEESLKPLFARLDLATVSADRALLPCFAEQVQVIHEHFGTDAEVLLPKNQNIKLRAQRQASIRTVSIPDFPFHLKMALSFTITSARRTMTPWTARMCIEVSQLLQDIAADPDIMPDPNLLWVARKTATACSADADFEEAKHLSVMLREDLEPRARELGQCFVLPATLFEVGGEDRVAHVVRLFGLKTLDARKAWFRDYTRLYLKAVIPPLLSHGICLEAHMQNVLARFEIGTNILRGFVYRDMGGLRMHVPTMSQRGVTIKSASLVPGGVILTEDLKAVWATAYHNIVANHLGGALRAMGLAWEGGWDIVREELIDALTTTTHYQSKAGELLRFMLQPVVKRKAFLRMKLAGVYREVSA